MDADLPIFGPRQVGKSTLSQQLESKLQWPCHRASADAVGLASVEWIAQQWERARLLKEQEGKGRLLILDEIQKIPQWSEHVKKSGTKIEPPMKEAFGITLDEFFAFGGYPGAVDFIKEPVLDSLIETTLSRDIFLMTRERSRPATPSKRDTLMQINGIGGKYYVPRYIISAKYSS